MWWKKSTCISTKLNELLIPRYPEDHAIDESFDWTMKFFKNKFLQFLEFGPNLFKQQNHLHQQSGLFNGSLSWSSKENHGWSWTSELPLQGAAAKITHANYGKKWGLGSF